MKVAVVDDWFDTLRTLPCFEKLAGHDVMIWTDHIEDEVELARRLSDTDALVLIRRERRSEKASSIGCRDCAS
jgi:D-3-phosphoglycerate dehydrogenase